MVIFDIDGKKVLKVSLQMELDTLDKKIARVLTARNELHQAICDLFNHDVNEEENRAAGHAYLKKLIGRINSVKE